MVVKTPKFCYVMESKLDSTAEQALEQICDKNYTLPFEVEDQQIVRIGSNFDSNIAEPGSREIFTIMSGV